MVLTKVFSARPSAVPGVQDFVRHCLAEAPLTEADNREVHRTILRVLLEAAGPAGKIQVSCRRYPDRVELDVLPTVVEHRHPVGGQPDGSLPPRSVAPQAAEPAAAVPSFAEWMAEALRREGITREAAARQLGVSVKTVSRWVGGETEPRLRELRRVQERFGDVRLH
ncbi:helix-turn-helix domain-containing protein [Allokutzneria oryzae]|uniref:Helix-turn-helix domain-containing protein n=1 Tax=Allokutzneria oryzae TaxID=1378989 RepID=A0ABV6A3W7_9PSEU